MPCLITPILLYCYFGKKWHRSVLQLLPQNALYIIIRTRNILQIGKSLGSVWIPAGSRALHCSRAGRAALRAAQRCSWALPPLAAQWDQSSTVCCREGPSLPSSFSRSQGTPTPGPEGDPVPTLAEPWVLHGAALEGALLQLHGALHHLPPSQGQLSQQTHHRK